MLDQLRPDLLQNSEVRRRLDGTEGIYHAETGSSFETSPEQANLVPLFDGKRSVLEISAEYMNRHGFVPFAALDDLMWGLADTDLLWDPPESLRRLGLLDRDSWFEMFVPTSILRWRLPWPTALRALELIAWPALAAWVVLTQPRTSLSALDVPLFYLGAMLALTLRARMKAVVCALFGFAPRRTQLVSVLGVLHIAPDPAVAVLMDQRPRMFVHLAALAGIASAIAIGIPWPGMWAGALIVGLLDLCPMIQSSGSGILGTLPGQVNLRERVRSYVALSLLKNLFSFKLPQADPSALLTAVLFLVWGAAFLSVVIGLGFPTGIALMDLGIQAGDGWTALLAYLGAFALLAVCPLPLVIAVVVELIELLFSLLWPTEKGGSRSGGPVDLSVFRAIPLFSTLSDADLALIASRSRQVTYDAGQVIVEQGALGNTFYSVRSGAAVVTRGESSERAKVVARLGAGDCFGETAMLKDGRRAATVRALSKTVVIELASEAFEKVVATVGGVEFAAVLRAANTIGKSMLFRELPAERLSSLATKFEPRRVPAGTEVVRFGEPGAEFYLVAKGQVDVLAPDGAKLTQLSDGDHFGEIALLRQVARTATVRTQTDTLLLVLSREVFLRALHADLSLSVRVEEIAASRVTRSKALAARTASGG